ncbi:MAG TPA: M28 family peptidase [Gemmatimonadaceae bacterium]|nr:M28 family peptidase [Gemmatimonadaceae bacterium]
MTQSWRQGLLALLCAALPACGGGGDEGAAAAAAGPFDGAKALEYVRQQLAFGARVPGTEAAVKGGDWIEQQMRARADTVVVQRWEHTTAAGTRLPLRNILARFNPAATERILYVTHWDSRPRSESASDSARRHLPVPGANDGASGVALFVALGDLLKQAPPRVGVDLLFVDGEDYGEFGPPDVDVLLGSRYFVDHLPDAGYQPLFGVLWDMVGDRDLRFQQEANSRRAAPEVVSLVWQAARSLGYGSTFVPEEGLSITDDHIPFLEKGLHVIDVIDLDFPWHHTPDDTIDKVSAASLKIVGDVAWALLQR